MVALGEATGDAVPWLINLRVSPVPTPNALMPYYAQRHTHAGCWLVPSPNRGVIYTRPEPHEDAEQSLGYTRTLVKRKIVLSGRVDARSGSHSIGGLGEA